VNARQQKQVSIFTWEDRYSVGIDVLDNQHKKLIRIVNQFHSDIPLLSGFDCLSTSFKRIRIYGTILSLRSYFLNHFSTEERFMMCSRYPGFFEHKKEHDLFIRRIFDFEDKFMQGVLNIAREMDAFLVMWLKKHTLEMDALYKDHLVSHFGKEEPTPRFEDITAMADESEEAKQ